MNNSVFGKTMENIENYVTMRLVSTEKEALELAAVTGDDKCTIFDQNLIVIRMQRTKSIHS